MTTQDSKGRAVTARCCAPVLRPTRGSVRGLALASVIANAVLVYTGVAVRLSSSGLGCPDWPQCTTTSVAAAHSAGQTSLNTAIEFGNRLLTFPLAGVTAVLLAAGTTVTGTGPLAGTVTGSHGHRTTVPCFHFALQDVTQLHADIGWFVGALAVALVIGLRFTGVPPRSVRASRIVPAGLAAPERSATLSTSAACPLAWVHVSISAMLWTLVLGLYLSTSEHGPLSSAAGTGACHESAARNLQAPGVTLGAEEGVS
jgi:hypothetical protein